MRIVIVDNDLSILRSLQLLLEDAGHEVRCFPDTREACTYLNTNAGVDFLLADYLISGECGLNFVESVQGKLNGTRIILVSAQANDIPAEALRKAGVNGVIQKPFDFEALLKVLSR